MTAGRAFADTTILASTGHGLGLAIPDGAYSGTLESMASSTIEVSDTSTVTEVNVQIAVDHTSIGDIVFKLQSPSGTVVTLMSRPGEAGGTSGAGDSSDADKESPISFGPTAVDDAESAGDTIGDSGVICRDDSRCSYVPNADGDGSGSLAILNGQATNGTWTLYAGDAIAGEIGAIDQWGLLIEVSSSNIPQTITFDPLADRTYGDVPFAVDAVASSGLTVDLASLSPAVCTMAGTTANIVTAGTCAIEATQPGDDTYASAMSVERSFAVDRARLTVDADDQSVVFGQPDPTFTFTYSGLVYDDTPADIDIAPTCAPPDQHSTIGDYPIACFDGADDNYAFTYRDGTLTIEPPASQTITFDPLPNRTYGEAPFAVSATASSGLPITFVTITPSTCSSAGSMITLAGAGTCAIEASQPGDASHSAAPEVSRSLSVAKAILTVTGNGSKTYGSQVSVPAAAYSGFVLGQTLATSDLEGSPTCSVGATRSSPVGTYPITCSLGTLSSTNYSFAFGSGALTVDSKTLVVKVANISRPYGAANPQIAVTYSGFVLGQKLATSGVMGSPSCSTAATPSSPVGTYPITCSLGTLSSTNYSFTFTVGKLTVKTATNNGAWYDVAYRTVNGVTITADIQQPTAGCAIPCPVVIVVHGGAWKTGDKSEFTPQLTRPGGLGKLLQPYGFVVMVVNYRLACKAAVGNSLCGYRFPAAEEDVQAAVDWAHANISAYGGDPNRITMIGSSAGAQIALDIATSGHGLAAVASWSAPTEFNCAEICQQQHGYTGCSIGQCPDAWFAATARNFVTPASTPAFIANSTNEIIPLYFAQLFVDALDANGVPNEFQIIPGRQHARDYQLFVLSDGRTVLDHTAQFLLDHSQGSIT